MTSNETDQVKSAAQSAAGSAKDAVDRAASWAGRVAEQPDAEHRVESLAGAAKQTVDAATATVKRTTDAAWDAAQAARNQFADTASSVAERGQRLGAQMVQQTHDQPVIAIMTALSAGILIGFSLSMLIRAR